MLGANIKFPEKLGYRVTSCLVVFLLLTVTTQQTNAGGVTVPFTPSLPGSLTPGEGDTATDGDVDGDLEAPAEPILPITPEALENLTPEEVATLQDFFEQTTVAGLPDIFGLENLLGPISPIGLTLPLSCPGCIAGHTALHIETREHFWNPATPAVDSEMDRNQFWMVETWFIENWLPMLMMMSEQLQATMSMQTSMIGQFFDAKHQLETQRMFQIKQAQAHKDYHPSKGMCSIGTNMRSMASSQRYSNLTSTAISNRIMQRQLLSGSTLSKEGAGSDAMSRLNQYQNVYCNPRDNNNGLGLLCENQERSGPDRVNRDVDYTRVMEASLTLDMDLTEGGSDLTPHEEDVFALASNIYASEPLPYFKDSWLSNPRTNRNEGDSLYMDFRSIAAKRSVALHSFSEITAMKTSGAPEVQPFLYATMQDLGLPDGEIEELMGERPSYYAQMEVATMKNLENPNFYTDLMDKPANVARKGAALQAISLMQDRDTYKSLMRQEMLLSVYLEMQLIKEQERVNSEIATAVRGTAEQMTP